MFLESDFEAFRDCLFVRSALFPEENTTEYTAQGAMPAYIS
jgi:hypothetical protein